MAELAPYPENPKNPEESVVVQRIRNMTKADMDKLIKDHEDDLKDYKNVTLEEFKKDLESDYMERTPEERNKFEAEILKGIVQKTAGRRRKSRRRKSKKVRRRTLKKTRR